VVDEDGRITSAANVSISTSFNIYGDSGVTAVAGGDSLTLAGGDGITSVAGAGPNVTFDVFALCLKSGNACVLKGGSDAIYSNTAIVSVIQNVLKQFNLDENTVALLPAGREETNEMLRAHGYIDLIIPRGSQALIDFVRENARIPVIETGAGICHTYFDKTGRRVSIEYALIKDMNDHNWRAELMAKKLNARGKGWVHVNPIPLNPTPGSVWTASTPEQTKSFLKILESNGIPTTLRDTRGKEIDGACGQLAASLED
jgi:hypothetical protein